MFIYSLIYFSVIIGIFYSFKKNRRSEKFFYILISLLIGLTVALRDQTMGPDTYNYLEYFLKPHNKLTRYQDSELEPGLTIFNDIIHLVINDKYIYSFIVSTLSLFPIFLLINKRSENVYLSLFIFISFSVASSLFILSFSMLRQFLALGLWAMLINYYMKNGERIDKKCIYLFMIMFCFHSSSIIVLLLYFIRNRNFPKKVYFIVLIGSMMFGFFTSKLMPMLMLFAESINNAFYFRTLNDNWSYSIIPTIPYVSLSLSMLYLLSEKDCNHIYIKGFFLAVILGNVMSFGNNVDRMCAYFYVISMLAIPYFFHKIKHSTYYGFIVILFLGYFSYKYWNVLAIMDNHEIWDIVPYRSFLN